MKLSIHIQYVLLNIDEASEACWINGLLSDSPNRFSALLLLFSTLLNAINQKIYSREAYI